MTRVLIKGENYTEIRTYNKDHETIQHWVLQRERKPEECGVWHNGDLLLTWREMYPKLKNEAKQPLETASK